QHYLKFHVVSFVLLFFLTVQYFFNYKEKENKNAKLVFTSFYLLTFAELFSILFIYSGEVYYIIAQFTQLLGYLVLLYMLLRIFYYDREKRKA
ncbi:MAG: hypothetical protein Q8Q35_00125, partial [Nanoarchaeota archaeon]|nr:hypothetical protein [Nanoarchaeota archaeon]